MMANKRIDPTADGTTRNTTGNSKDGPSGTLDDLSYEEAYGRLEHVLQTLESGNLPLEESLELYELGAMLADYCARKLDEAELRVRQWQPGELTTELDDWEES